jgi:hypothetical protein
MNTVGKSNRPDELAILAKKCAIALLFGAGIMASLATSPTECTSDAECVPLCEADADLIRTQVQSPVREVTSRCDVASPSCDCLDGDTVLFTLDPSAGGCTLRSDRTNQCLMEPAEVPECSEDADCQSACDIAQARSIDDLDRPVAVEISRSQCSGFCTCEFEIDGTCGRSAPRRRQTDLLLRQCPADQESR